MRFLYTFAYEKQEKAAVLSKTAAFAEILKFRKFRPTCPGLGASGPSART